MPFVVFLDACVLYPANLRDVLLHLAEEEFYQIRWSPDVLDEMERNVARRANARSPEAAASGAQYTRETMEQSFPDALTDRTAYAGLIPAMTNSLEDRHVLAAAIASKCDMLVTANLQDFPPSSTAAYGIEIQHPDMFLVHQFTLSQERLLASLTRLAASRRQPMNSVSSIAGALSSTAPNFSTQVLSWLQ